MVSLGGKDFHGVAAAKLGVEGDHSAADLGADTGVPDVGMDCVGEVDRSRPSW